MRRRGWFCLMGAMVLASVAAGQDATILLVRGGRLVTEDSIAVGASDHASGPSPGKSFLLSALIPGAGQLYQGRKIGWAFVALDAALWGGYFTTRSRGNHLEDDFRSYADQHYVLSNPGFSDEGGRGWLEWWSFFRAVDPDYAWADSIYWEDISYDREHSRTSYYQEIDVSDVYIYGWDDWAPNPYNNEEYWRFDNEGHIEFTYSSANRQEYRTMRNDADAYKKWSGWCLGGALLLRAASAIEALRTARSDAASSVPSLGVHVDWHRSDPRVVLSCARLLP